MDAQETWSTILSKLGAWGDAVIAMLPNVALAVLVVVLGWLAARILRNATDRLLARVHVPAPATLLLARLVYSAALAGGLMIALSILQLEKAVTSVLAGAGIVGLALGFAFQDLAANFISGIGLSIRRPFHIGDLIETNEVVGRAEEIALRTTTVATLDGKYVMIPNKDIFQGVLINHSRSHLRRVDVECGVSYGENLSAVRNIVLEVLTALDQRDPEHPTELFFTGFGDSSIDFVARFWIRYDDQRDLLDAQSTAIIALKAAFDEAGVTIPFPIRTLDFGIKGGEKLSEMLGGS